MRTPGTSRAVLDGASQTLDLARPVGILMIDVLNFIADAADVVAGLVAAVAPGSYLTVMQPAEDDGSRVAQRLWNRVAEPQIYLRGRRRSRPGSAASSSSTPASSR